MLFGLKKVIAYLLMPLPICIIAMAFGLWLSFRGRRIRLGRNLILGGLGVLLLFSQVQVSHWLLGPLEREYPAIPELPAGAPVPDALARCRYIVVLGGGHHDVVGLSGLDQLSQSSRARLTEAVLLWRRIPEARLVVSGPANARDYPTHAAVLATAAISLGVPADRIDRVDSARDTAEEAANIIRLVDGAPIALVTSAWHQPRAVALFQATGADVLPCPTDHLTLRSPGWNWERFGFDVDSLERSGRAIHERLGLIWARITGQI